MKRVIPVLGVVASIVSYSPSALALEPSAIYAKAKEFTVQIDGEETGTGTIIENNNGTYTVLTCWHVMDTPGDYQITTADGAIHEVTDIEELPDVDLAIVTFSSDNTYPVAELGDSAQATGGFQVYASAYPAPTAEFPERNYTFKSGQIESRYPNKEDGYEIIHDVGLTLGSSGGGLFDNEARLIGINGQLITNPNTGTFISLAIPTEIYLAAQDNLIAETEDIDDFDNTSQALGSSAIHAKAKEFTVQINGEEKGTGTIVENNNGTYTVLTCRHVIDTPGNYQVTTADGSVHPATKIKKLPDADLATITFSSNNAYLVAELGDSETAIAGQEIHVVGYNAPFPGLTQREYLPESGQVRVRKETDEEGYEIIHSAVVTSGSSGGGIFDSEARLIGVNGQVVSDGNTGKAYGRGIPLEIYQATPNYTIFPSYFIPSLFE